MSTAQCECTRPSLFSPTHAMYPFLCYMYMWLMVAELLGIGRGMSTANGSMHAPTHHHPGHMAMQHHNMHTHP